MQADQSVGLEHMGVGEDNGTVFATYFTLLHVDLQRAHKIPCFGTCPDEIDCTAVLSRCVYG